MISLNRPYTVDGALYDLAGIYAAFGDIQKAYQYLHTIERREITFPSFIVWWVQSDEFFKNLRGEEEFKNIVERQENKWAKVRAEIEKLRADGNM